MPIALDATSSGQGAAGTSITHSHTCSGSDGVLTLTCVSNDAGNVTAATYNGVAMTKSVDRQGTNADVVVFSLVGPATGANDIVITKGNGVEVYFGVASFTGAGGVDATGQSGTNESGTSASVTVNTNRTIGYVVTGLFWEGGEGIVTYTGSGTQYATVDGAASSNTGRFTYQAYAGGADITETWTKSGGNTPWIAAGIEVYETVGFSPKVMTF